MSNTLLPCPFCGGENPYIDGYEHSAGLRWRVVCLGCMGMVDPGTTQQKYRAIEAWNRRAEPENKPLTLEELRQMDGEPVWVVTLDGTDEPRWGIVTSAEKHGTYLLCALNGVATADYADFDSYNDTWVAYRHKPKEETP